VPIKPAKILLNLFSLLNPTAELLHKTTFKWWNLHGSYKKFPQTCILR